MAPGELPGVVDALAAELAVGAPRAQALTKVAVNDATLVELERAFTRERRGQKVLSLSADHAEGVAAFVDKRKPTFTGR